MANRKTRPTSPGRRFGTYQLREELSGDEPTKGLTEGKKRSSGRNSKGRVTSRHRGGGAKRRYRKIDFKRTKDGVPAKVATIEYDPNRSAYIALLNYADGDKAYILAPQGLTVGAEVASGEGADIAPGNALPLSRIPTGHRGPQRRARARPGRPPRPRRRHRDPGGGEGGPDGLASASPPRRCGWCAASAAPRSARSPTPSTRTSAGARPAAAATAASARRREASP